MRERDLLLLGLIGYGAYIYINNKISPITEAYQTITTAPPLIIKEAQKTINSYLIPPPPTPTSNTTPLINILPLPPAFKTIIGRYL